MKKRTLGKSGLEVSEIGLGCWQLGGDFGPVDDARANDILAEACRRGIDFWDTAEYVTTSHIVGVPHQPGTPLYVLVGRVFDVVLGDADITVPAHRTAWAINFMSAFFSSLAVMLVYLVVWELARRADTVAWEILCGIGRRVPRRRLFQAAVGAADLGDLFFSDDGLLVGFNPQDPQNQRGRQA